VNRIPPFEKEVNRIYNEITIWNCRDVGALLGLKGNMFYSLSQMKKVYSPTGQLSYPAFPKKNGLDLIANKKIIEGHDVTVKQ
jgi:hypothetical protein